MRVRIHPVEHVAGAGPLAEPRVLEALQHVGAFRAIVASPNASSRAWVPRKRTTGIYVLDVGDGFVYVGQTIDLAVRLNHHRKTWPALRAVCFLPTRRDALNHLEQTVARTLDGCGCRLRNRTLIDVIAVATPLNALVSAEAQARWITKPAWNDWSGERRVNADLRHRYASAFQQFQGSRRSSQLITALQEFVALVIPAPIKTEIEYWSVSCSSGSRTRPDARVNVGFQTLLDVADEGPPERPWFRFYAPAQLVADALGCDVGAPNAPRDEVRLVQIGVKASIYASRLTAASPDQVLVVVDGLPDFRRVLRHTPFLVGLRRLSWG